MIEKIGPAVTVPGGQVNFSVDSAEAELTQAIRRLNRAVIAAKIEAGMRTGKPVMSTPLAAELEKQLTQLENLRLAYNLKDSEVEGAA